MGPRSGLNDNESTPLTLQGLNSNMKHLDLTDDSTETGSVTVTTDASSVTHADAEPPNDASTLASEMHKRCRTLLDELEQFKFHLKQLKKENNIELRTFWSGLQAEMKLIEKVSSLFFCSPCYHWEEGSLTPCLASTYSKESRRS
jgi:hypothetical protein